MKRIIALFALVLAGAIMRPTIAPSSNQAENAAIHTVTGHPQATVALAADAPVSRELEPVISPPLATPDLREHLLKVLYESPSVDERLDAARNIAASGDEPAFLDLTTFIVAAEGTGIDMLVDVAKQVAGILAQMHGAELQTIAIEAAYSPSALIAEAAVDAAVRMEPLTNPQWLDSGLFQNPANQNALDALLQQLADYDRKEVLPLPER